MNNIICDNPYRILGVFANATQKEISASLGKMKAFLKVGKDVSFDLDLKRLVGNISRTPEDIEKAQVELTLPPDRIKYAQFWFIKKTSFDEIAISHLVENNASKAIEILSKRTNFSSLNNLIVLSLILKDYASAIKYAETFYKNHESVSEFEKCISGDKVNVDPSLLIDNFLEYLKTQLTAEQLVGLLNSEWALKVGEDLSKPIIDDLNKDIQDLKISLKDDSVNHIEIGLNAYQNILQKRAQLKSLLSENNTKYTVIADKYSQLLLQCAIQKFNSMEIPCKEDIRDCIDLAKKALFISEGALVKERINENITIFEDTSEKAVSRSVLNKVNKSAPLLSKLLDIQSNITDYSLVSCLNLAREFKSIFSMFLIEYRYSEDEKAISLIASSQIGLFLDIIVKKRKVLDSSLILKPATREDALNNLAKLRTFFEKACDILNILSSVNVSFAERKQFEEVVEFYMKEKNSLDAVHNKINNQMRQASYGCAVITAGIFFLFFTIIFLGAKGICALV